MNTIPVPDRTLESRQNPMHLTYCCFEPFPLPLFVMLCGYVRLERSKSIMCRSEADRSRSSHVA